MATDAIGSSADAGGVSASKSATTPEPTEAELERLMIAAELAGRTTVADALARELEALRHTKLARPGPPLRVAK